VLLMYLLAMGKAVEGSPQGPLTSHHFGKPYRLSKAKATSLLG